MTYPKPATPLPWHGHPYQGDIDAAYATHAANAFPHLIAALQEILACYPLSRSMVNTIDHALAIARGESKE